MTRIGIIGTGAIASAHLDAYRQFPERSEVVAVCDMFEDKAQSFVKQYSLSAAVYSDYTKMLSNPGIDAVSICLPPSLHAQATIDALEHGKHVLVEKPMASSLEECDRMIEAAQRNGKILSVVCQNRFKTPVARVKKMVDSGAVGKVLLATFNSLWWRGETYYDLFWRGTWEQESGGCFLNHSVHHVDLMHMLFGVPKTVRGFITNLGHDNSQCEDLGFALFDYGNMIVNFTSSLISHGEKQTISIQGKNGSLEIPWSVEAFKPSPNGFPEQDREAITRLQGLYDSLPQLPYEGHPAQIRNFLCAIGGEEPLIIDGNEGRSTLELIIAVYKSSVLGKPVTLPILKDDLFYRKESMLSCMPRFHEKKRSVDNFGPSSGISLGRDMGT